jgi:nitroreductase
MIVELLGKRVSVRKYQDKPIPPAILQTILEAGRLSPSGGNEQPWIFGVITDSELIADIAKLAYRQTWIAQAPLLIVLCTIGVGDGRGGRDVQRMRYPEYTALIDGMDQELYWALNQEEHQTKIVGTHMALAALEHGIGSCWVSRFEVKRLARLLGLPENHLPSEILVFGYPKANGKTSAKKSLDEVVFYNHYSSEI